MAELKYRRSGLVLWRSAGERIFVTRGDETIIITVTKVSGKTAYVGVDADDSWRIDREEIHVKRQGGSVNSPS